MENEFEIWVLSRASDLVSRDFSGVRVATDQTTSAAFGSAGASTLSLNLSEITTALETATIDAAALSSPTDLIPLARAESALNLYRFTGTDSGLIDRLQISAFSEFGTELNDSLASSSTGPITDDEQYFGLGGDDVIQAGPGADQIFAGAGVDTAVSTSPQAAHTLMVGDGSLTLTDRTEANGIDTLFDVEGLSFQDTTAGLLFDLTTFAGLSGLSGP